MKTSHPFLTLIQLLARRGAAGLHICRRRFQSAFTLIELLVVIGIISLLAAMLMPALSMARNTARSVKCVSNMKQLGLMASSYTGSFDGMFPIAYDGAASWDVRGNDQPGIMYVASDYSEIQQCPAFMDESDFSDTAVYTGYNYNVTYVGHGVNETERTPAKVSQIRKSSECALFGDGEYMAGGRHYTNKYMRAPYADGRLAAKPADMGQVAAGVQGYRHRGKTNICWADGHADSVTHRNAEHYDPGGLLDVGLGFVSDDDSLYDLD